MAQYRDICFTNKKLKAPPHKIGLEKAGLLAVLKIVLLIFQVLLLMFKFSTGQYIFFLLPKRGHFFLYK